MSIHCDMAVFKEFTPARQNLSIARVVDQSTGTWSKVTIDNKTMAGNFFE